MCLSSPFNNISSDCFVPVSGWSTAHAKWFVVGCSVMLCAWKPGRRDRDWSINRLRRDLVGPRRPMDVLFGRGRLLSHIAYLFGSTDSGGGGDVGSGVMG